MTGSVTPSNQNGTLLLLFTLSLLALTLQWRYALAKAGGLQWLLNQVSSIFRNASLKNRHLDDAKVRGAVDALRTKYFTTFMAWLCFVSQVALGLLLIGWRNRVSDQEYQHRLAVTLVCNVISSVFHLELIRPDARVIDLTLGVLKLILLWRTCYIGDISTLCGLYSYRQLIRFGIAMAELNHASTGLFAVLTSAAQCYAAVPFTDLNLSLVAGGEISNVIATWAFFHFLETSLTERVAAVIEAREASFERMASSRLLSIFSDAEAFLSADLQIMRPAKRLSALLISKSDFQGKSFESLLDEADRSRFVSFIATSLAASPEVPVGSLQISLRDSQGLPLKATLFHVRISDEPGVPTHLIGISCLAEREPLADLSGDCELPVSTSCEALTPEADGLSFSSASALNMHTDKKRFETFKLQTEDFPDIEQIQLTFDPWDDFPVHECSITCGLPERSEDCKPSQALKNWMMPDSWKRFSAWAQVSINDWCASECVEKPILTDLQLKIPSLFGKAQIMLAEKASLDMGNSEDGRDNEEELDLPVLTLEGIRLQKRKKTSSTKSLPMIAESASRRQRGTGGLEERGA